MINSLLPSINLSPDALLAFVAFSQLPVASCQFRCSAIGNSHLFFLLSGTAHRERTEATAEERLDLTQESVGLQGDVPGACSTAASIRSSGSSLSANVCCHPFAASDLAHAQVQQPRPVGAFREAAAGARPGMPNPCE